MQYLREYVCCVSVLEQFYFSGKYNHELFKQETVSYLVLRLLCCFSGWRYFISEEIKLRGFVFNNYA